MVSCIRLFATVSRALWAQFRHTLRIRIKNPSDSLNATGFSFTGGFRAALGAALPDDDDEELLLLLLLDPLSPDDDDDDEEEELLLIEEEELEDIKEALRTGGSTGIAGSGLGITFGVSSKVTDFAWGDPAGSARAAEEGMKVGISGLLGCG